MINGILMEDFWKISMAETNRQIRHFKIELTKSKIRRRGRSQV